MAYLLVVSLGPAVAGAQAWYGRADEHGAVSIQIASITRNTALQRVTEVRERARIVPVWKDGIWSGMRLLAISAGSFFSVLGFRNGDIVRSVDEISIEDFESLLEAEQAVEHRDSFLLTLERNGRTILLRMEIPADGSGLWVDPSGAPAFVFTPILP